MSVGIKWDNIHVAIDDESNELFLVKCGGPVNDSKTELYIKEKSDERTREVLKAVARYIRNLVEHNEHKKSGKSGQN